MRNTEVELRLGTVWHTSDSKYLSWPQKVERWANRNSKQNSYKQKWQTPSRKSKTCENEKIQYCRKHPNQILNFGLEIQEYFHTEPPCGKGHSRIRTQFHSTLQNLQHQYKMTTTKDTHHHANNPESRYMSHSCHCTKCLGESAKMRKHLLNERKDLA
jgi:hypothetical protein